MGSRTWLLNTSVTRSGAPYTEADRFIPGLIALTDSASTPRLRATFAIYLGLVAASAVIGPDAVSSTAYYVSGLLGFLCVALACLGRIWTSVFIAGHKDVELVTTGPYARCRHPLYACSVLGALGLGLTTRSVLLCVIVVVLIAALVIYAAACEEQFLADSFPEAFQAYESGFQVGVTKKKELLKQARELGAKDGKAGQKTHMADIPKWPDFATLKGTAMLPNVVKACLESYEAGYAEASRKAG